MADKIFAQGFFFKQKENAPSFVIGRMSIKVSEAIEFLKANEKNGYVNLDIKESQNGKHYVELDTFVPDKSRSGNSTPSSANSHGGDDLPF